MKLTKKSKKILFFILLGIGGLIFLSLIGSVRNNLTTTPSTFKTKPAEFKIPEMFPKSLIDPEITIAKDQLNYGEKQPVYRYKIDERQQMRNLEDLAKKLGVERNVEMETTSQVYYEDNISTLTYNRDSLVLIYTNQVGKTIGSEIRSYTSEESTTQFVNLFFTTYFPNAPKLVIDAVEFDTENDVNTLKGFYLHEGTRIGNVFIEGYAFTAKVNRNVGLTSLQMWLIETDNIIEEQEIPIKRPDILINEHPNQPKQIFYEPNDLNFQNLSSLLRASARLTEANIIKISEVNMFKGKDYEYIAPCYQLTGSGNLETSQQSNYTALVNIIMMSVDPMYLSPYEGRQPGQVTEPGSPIEEDYYLYYDPVGENIPDEE